MVMVTGLAMNFACAQTENRLPDVQNPGNLPDSEMPTPAVPQNQSESTVRRESTASNHPTIERVLIEFEENSSLLNERGRALISVLADKAKVASSILLTGYCSRSTINHKELAIARAMSVKTELAHYGLAPKTLHVEYVIGRARNAVTIDLKMQ